jgi:hypothetical protein
MSETHEINYLLTINAEPTYSEMRKLEIILIRNLNYIRRLAGSEQLDKIIQKIQEVIMWMRIMEMAFRAFEMAAGPLGWAYAITSIIGAGFATAGLVFGDQLEIQSHGK